MNYTFKSGTEQKRSFQHSRQLVQELQKKETVFLPGQKQTQHDDDDDDDDDNNWIYTQETFTWFSWSVFPVGLTTVA